MKAVVILFPNDDLSVDSFAEKLSKQLVKQSVEHQITLLSPQDIVTALIKDQFVEVKEQPKPTETLETVITKILEDIGYERGRDSIVDITLKMNRQIMSDAKFVQYLKEHKEILVDFLYKNPNGLKNEMKLMYRVLSQFLPCIL